MTGQTNPTWMTHSSKVPTEAELYLNLPRTRHQRTDVLSTLKRKDFQLQNSKTDQIRTRCVRYFDSTLSSPSKKTAYNSKHSSVEAGTSPSTSTEHISSVIRNHMRGWQACSLVVKTPPSQSEGLGSVLCASSSFLLL